MSLWVTDSSPLIFLAKLNRLDLLRKEAEEVLAPPAVLGEIAGQDDEAKRHRRIECKQALGLSALYIPHQQRPVIGTGNYPE